MRGDPIGRGGRGLARAALATLLASAQLAWLAEAGPARALDARPPAGTAAPPRAAAPEPGPRAMPGAEGGRLLLCESDGGYRRCPADTSAGVALVRELSTSRCAARSTWGFDGAGIWVDKGCRGEFRVAEPAAAPAPPAGAPAPQGTEREAGAGSTGGPDTATVLTILGALVAGGAAAALLSGDDDEKSRKQKAVALCGRRLDRMVKERGGKGGEILRIERARQRGGELELEAVAKAEWRRGPDSRGRIDCLVDFKGKNEVLAFRQSGLWGGGWGGSGGSWGGGASDDRGGRERAVQACLRAAEARGLSRVRALDADKDRRVWRVELEGRAGGRGARALCEYDPGRRRAAILAQGRGGRG